MPNEHRPLVVSHTQWDASVHGQSASLEHRHILAVDEAAGLYECSPAPHTHARTHERTHQRVSVVPRCTTRLLVSHTEAARASVSRYREVTAASIENYREWIGWRRADRHVNKVRHAVWISDEPDGARWRSSLDSMKRQPAMSSRGLSTALDIRSDGYEQEGHHHEERHNR